MKKDTKTHTSQDYDRKHKQDHTTHNPRAAKDIPTPQDSAVTEDKRMIAREEHTNHFTNRAPKEGQ